MSTFQLTVQSTAQLIQEIAQETDRMVREIAHDGMALFHKRADEIIFDIHDQHCIAMEDMDIKEERREIQATISDALHPHKSVSDWWEDLSDDDRDSWYETYYTKENGSIDQFTDYCHFGQVVMAFIHAE